MSEGKMPTFKVTSDGEKLQFIPKELQLLKRGVCAVEIYEGGYTVSREKHEPDEELEDEYVKDITGIMQVKMEGSWIKVLDIRICKHCGCLYVEKS